MMADHIHTPSDHNKYIQIIASTRNVYDQSSICKAKIIKKKKIVFPSFDVRDTSECSFL